eukprot:TRINITY_DN7928_c0_g1_i2.p1 TRINITY_DN7928_c0_g1~~TRINITY_DN7928_c0_g1_i2.p1  ORF type:complete len:221 (-),score=24.43 TRINITY_DN7928_c0_g1_i2:33-695(-)
MSHRVMRRNALQTRTFSNHNSVAVRASLDAERQPANVLPEPNAVALPAPMALENAAPAENPANVPPEMGIPDLLQVNFQQVFRALGNLGLNIAEVNARQEQLVNADIDPGDIIRQLVAREREEWELDVRGFASEHGVALSLDATINKIFDEIAVAMSAAGAFTKRRVILWFVIVHLFVRGIKILPNRIARQVADYIELLEEGDLQGACPHLHAYLQGVRE